MLKFQSQLCQQCSAEKDRAGRGTLVVSVGYLEYKRALEVTVMAGKGLPGLDKTGELYVHVVAMKLVKDKIPSTCIY